MVYSTINSASTSKCLAITDTDVASLTTTDIENALLAGAYDGFPGTLVVTFGTMYLSQGFLLATVDATPTAALNTVFPTRVDLIICNGVLFNV